MATDYVQRLNEGLVAALDTFEGICDLTEQSEGNVVLWRDNLAALLSADRKGILAYHVVSVTRGGGAIGDFRRFRVSVTAAARSETIANALCEQVELGLTSVTLAALAAPLDVRIEDVSRQPVPPDVDTAVHLATVDFILVLKR